ncbi:hypothetical protein CsSME_00031515 [Camellia sinensis var. sinensis]
MSASGFITSLLNCMKHLDAMLLDLEEKQNSKKDVGTHLENEKREESLRGTHQWTNGSCHRHHLTETAFGWVWSNTYDSIYPCARKIRLLITRSVVVFFILEGYFCDCIFVWCLGSGSF